MIDMMPYAQALFEIGIESQKDAIYLDQLKELGFSIDVKRPPIMPAQRFQKRKSRN